MKRPLQGLFTRMPKPNETNQKKRVHPVKRIKEIQELLKRALAEDGQAIEEILTRSKNNRSFRRTVQTLMDEMSAKNRGGRFRRINYGVLGNRWPYRK